MFLTLGFQMYSLALSISDFINHNFCQSLMVTMNRNTLNFSKRIADLKQLFSVGFIILLSWGLGRNVSPQKGTVSDLSVKTINLSDLKTATPVHLVTPVHR